MALMHRALGLALLWFGAAGAATAQPLTVLHINVALTDAGKAAPVPRHVLLISDNPPSAPPRRIVTGADGTAEVRLRPGNYTVESDRPVALNGKAYEWTQVVEIAAGKDATLELTAANAEVESVAPGTATSATPLAADPSTLLMQWQDSVVALWTPTAHATGFVVDTNGLIATNQRVIGTALSVEVQLTATVKVAGSVLVADAARDVVIVRINPAALGAVRAVPLGCALAAKVPVVEGQDIFTIGVPLRDQKSPASGTVTSINARAMVSDIKLASGSAGGPVFAADGSFVGLTSTINQAEESRQARARIVRAAEACDVIASAGNKLKDAPVPSDAHLPVEPLRPFPAEALADAAQHRVGSLNPYK